MKKDDDRWFLRTTRNHLIWLKKAYKQEMSVKFGKTTRLTKRRELRRRHLRMNIESTQRLWRELVRERKNEKR